MTTSRWLPNIALSLLGVSIGLTAAELILRWSDYEYHPLKIAFGDSDQRAFHAFNDSHFVYDPELLWRPKPGFEFFNAQGFRGPELSYEKPVGEFRIYAVGDSNTLGLPDASWPDDLHAILHQSCDRFQVVNAGVWGYTSEQGLRRLEEVRKFRPDLVLISFGANDAHPVAVPDKDYTARSKWSRSLEGLLYPSHLARLAMGVILQQSVRRKGELTHRVSLEDYRTNLEEMVRRARQDGAVPVLLTRPYHGKMPPDVTWMTFAHDYNAVTANVAERFALPLVDLYTLFKDRHRLFVDESHFSAQGHRLAAEAVYQRIQPFLGRDALAACGSRGQRPRVDDSE